MDFELEPLEMRKRYYEKNLDIDYLLSLNDWAIDNAIAKGAATYDDLPPASGGEGTIPNLVSSLCDDGMHRPALDIDIPIQVIPSTTPGHSHLYIPGLALTWEQYVKLMEALAEAGIIEKGYLSASINRGASFLRPPGVRKWTAEEVKKAKLDKKKAEIDKYLDAVEDVDNSSVKKASPISEPKVASSQDEPLF